MTDAITYGNLLLKLGETPLSVYQLSIVEEAGKHGLMSVSAETEEGAKEYLLYEEYGDMALYANLGQALQPIFYGIVTQMEIKAIGSRCAVYPETVILSCFIDLMVLFSFISAKNSVAILSNISPDMDSSIMPNLINAFFGTRFVIRE